MNTRWETFEGRQHGRTARREPRVTLGCKGTFYLNGAAYEALGAPAAVEMLYDGRRRIIGLRPVDERKRNAFALKHHGKAGNYKRISAAAFCNHFQIPNRDTVLFDEIGVDNEGVMALDMTKTSYVGRGAR